MEKPLFTGVCTALVTPFLNGRINYPMVNILLQRQIDAGISAVVIAGTTGESATLTDDEIAELIRYCKAFAGSKMLIIAGSGSNSTAHAIEKSVAAENAGADALLIVSPYYNKATPDGLVSHYAAIAKAVTCPIILYNVPSRTGQDIPLTVYQRLAAIPNIVGVKEAINDPAKIMKIKAYCPARFQVWAGNDEMTVPFMSIGAAGVISVISNLFPEETAYMADAALDGDFDTASALQIKLLPWTEFLSCEVNPIPVKAAMTALGLDCGTGRSPLTELNAAHQRQLKLLIQ
ncbi:MAG: 4-hydroxy-tetrahydrodipicolinate synthase [Ruminococcaceae bacterium]|nr:4-hydroxy-tetrahydrodipicolinate synthase [Oscillospiraceae bacterium]